MKYALFAAILLAAVPASAQDTGNVLARFLEARGENIEACFKDLPEMEASLRDAEFRGEKTSGPVAPRRLIVAFDASGSMAGTIGNVTKMEAARQAVGALLEGVPEDVALGLVAFGHRGNNEDSGQRESCAGVETLVPETPGNGATLRERMDGLEPTGWTPLAAALEAAGAELAASETPGEQVVYVVSDGEETCGGDPVAVAHALHESDVRAVVNILGLDLPAEERAQLEAVAAAGGGLFASIESESDLARRIEEMRRSNANNFEIQRTRNQASFTQLRNNNKTFGALLSLDNCIGGRSLREGNRVRKWVREEGISAEAEQALRDDLARSHVAYKARAAEIRANAEGLREEANTAVQQKMDEAEGDYDRLR
ncbi:VWA domain-containing protein [uncultured Jannaschia sp.]|uniref:vWA domain-containing protein n=1 Tax=uncultured Jannaschia sp. TaxID=293347 RepID=UPI002629676F|nr:VWA domain-containing protein [uncultured Jannaschia sp.]